MLATKLYSVFDIINGNRDATDLSSARCHVHRAPPSDSPHARELWRDVSVRRIHSAEINLISPFYGTSTAHATTFHPGCSLVHSKRSAGDCSSPKCSRLADK